MDILTDVALLSRIQFALTVALSIGLGLITAIFATKYYRSRDEKDGAAVRLWVKIFTATFAIGVATGITMEFSFGTNWADYSRFVGDIFGAPLAAEALFTNSGLPGRMIPIPSQVSAGCGLAWKAEVDERPQLLAALAQAGCGYETDAVVQMYG